MAIITYDTHAHTNTHTEGRYSCLESVKHLGQHVGILPDGKVKPSGSTGSGQHG